jgi:CHAD domain-containing protein
MHDLAEESPASTVLLSYLGAQVQVLRKQEERVRADESDSVHAMRVATRRLSAALVTFRKLLDPDVVAHLREELSWLAGALGAARDAEVIHARLRRLVAEQPPELDVGPVSQRVDDELEAELENAQRTLVSALDSSRYARLLDALDALLANPRLTPWASKEAHKTLPHLVDKAGARLRRAVETAEAAEGSERDSALHEVRKCAKRLRYASEVLAPIRPERAADLIDAAQDMQRILGDHHDSVVARDLLLRLGTAARQRGESDFTYRRLHELETASAAESEALFVQAWRAFPSTSLSR